MERFMSRVCIPIFSLLFLITGNFGSAMRIQSQESVFAWSDDGQGCIVERSEYGPEGGGSLSFRLIVPVKNIDETFAVSRNFSLGGSEEPQTVSDSSCRENLARMKKRFREIPFREVTVDSGAVARDRHFAVLNNGTNGAGGYFWSTTDAREREQKGTDDFQMQFNGGKFTLRHFGKPVVVWMTGIEPGGSLFEGALSPSGKLFLVFVSGENRDKDLEAVYYLKPGQKEEWESFVR